METETKVIGQGLDRWEGRAKVTGRANYAADNHLDGLVHAYSVVSTIAAGRITGIDASAAERAPGFLGIWHHGNVPKLYRSPNDMQAGNRVSEVRTPFEDDGVYYAGQFVAVVAAQTFEQARAAARLVRVAYREDKPIVSLAAAIDAHADHPPRKRDENSEEPQKDDTVRGDPEGAWNAAPTKIDATYEIAVEVHNPMELHAAVAAWTGGKLEVHDSTQWVVGQRKALAKVFGIEPENVTVQAPYVGGGFGGKLFLWPHTIIAAFVARELGRPVKFVIERRQEFTTAGHRPMIRQRLRVAADAGGRLVSLRHDAFNNTSFVDEYVESCTGTSKVLYQCPNIAVTQRIAELNTGTPTPMRGPGAAPGTFALECALDELALALRLDPLELRLRNQALTDQSKDLPWSSNHLRDCYQIAAERFGWSHRNPVPGSMRDGDEILGWGMATATWPGERDKARARVEIRADGTARVSCATQDIGTGTYTVIAQVASEVLGLPVDKIDVAIGSSAFPEGPISGGSQATATIVPAIAEASRKAMQSLLRAAVHPAGVFAGQDSKSLAFQAGVVVAKDGKSASVSQVLSAARISSADGEAATQPGDERKKYAFRCFGAQFIEVRWDPGIARLRVSRIVGVFDAGRIINKKTATNQIVGGMLMGMGMGLFERSVYDQRSGRVVTDNVADYLMPLMSDLPGIDVVLLDRPDPYIGEFGARGLGEIGITGVPAAIVNAIHHATGKRLRSIPVMKEDLLS